MDASRFMRRSISMPSSHSWPSDASWPVTRSQQPIVAGFGILLVTYSILLMPLKLDVDLTTNVLHSL